MHHTEPDRADGPASIHQLFGAWSELICIHAVSNGFLKDEAQH
jgi:hypothetical protein